MSPDILSTASPCDKDALFAKAQRYTDEMFEKSRDDWMFGFWSALALEMLARAALSNLSPVLLADTKDWNNLYLALGKQPNAPKFTPKSIDVSEVFKRLETILPDFTRELVNFSVIHMDRRNSEVHTGYLAFEGIGTSEWLPTYYLACEALLKSIDESIESLFGAEESKTAKLLIVAHQDKSAQAVRQSVNAHKTVWEGKNEEERTKLIKQAEVLASKSNGHRVACPSCATVALLHGSPIGSISQQIEDELVIERQSMLPTQFECTACGLKISGFSKLNACGLGDSYTSKSYYDAVEFFGIEARDWDGFEPDNNE